MQTGLKPAKENDPETGLLADKFNNGIQQKQKKEVRSQLIKLSIMITMTFLVFLIELFVGYFHNSVALVADAFHMLSDVLALSVALACILIAKRKSKSNTFGWVRAEVVGALVNGVFLLALCFSIFIESIEHILEPHELKEPLNVLIVGIIGLLVNVIGIFLFHGHSHGGGSHGHSHGGDEEEAGIVGYRDSYLATSHQDGAMAIADFKNSDRSLNNGTVKQAQNDVDLIEQPNTKADGKDKSGSQMNMKGVYLHIITDFIGSVIVIFTASISIWLPEFQLFKLYMDPVLSMIMVVLIMSSTIPLVHETALILLQTTPGNVNVEKIERQIMQLPGVLAVHEHHIWRLVGVRIIATVHIRFESLEHYLKSAEQIRDIFHNHKIHSVTVQPEFNEMTERGGEECVLKCKPEDCQGATCCPTSNLLPKPSNASLNPKKANDQI